MSHSDSISSGGLRSAWPAEPGAAWTWAGLIAGLALICMACVLCDGVNRPAMAAGVLSSQTLTPAAPGILLFADDFATYSGRWTEAESAKAVVAYRDQALRIRVVSPGVAAWSLPDFRLVPDAFRAQVVVRFREGGDDGLSGLVLDYDGEGGFLAVAISRGGDVRVLHYQGGDWFDLTPAEFSQTAGERVTGPVMLRADVRDDALEVFLDDVPVGEIALGQLLGGGALGVMARAGRGYVDVTFDDFAVIALPSREG